MIRSVPDDFGKLVKRKLTLVVHRVRWMGQSSIPGPNLWVGKKFQILNGVTFLKFCTVYHKNLPPPPKLWKVYGFSIEANGCYLTQKSLKACLHFSREAQVSLFSIRFNHHKPIHLGCIGSFPLRPAYNKLYGILCTCLLFYLLQQN